MSKRKAVIETFGPIPLDSQYVDFLYARRHLAKVRDPRLADVFEPAYIAQFFELDDAISKTLAEIRRRDGVEIVREVIKRLIGSLEIENELPDAHDPGMVADFRDRLG
jgi:hypothetical protein